MEIPVNGNSSEDIDNDTVALTVVSESERLSRRMDRLEEEVGRLAQLVRGNGDEGILGQLLLLNERVGLLRGQWRWIVGLLAGLLVATVGRALLAG